MKVVECKGELINLGSDISWISYRFQSEPSGSFSHLNCDKLILYSCPNSALRLGSILHEDWVWKSHAWLCLSTVWKNKPIHMQLFFLFPLLVLTPDVILHFLGCLLFVPGSLLKDSLVRKYLSEVQLTFSAHTCVHCPPTITAAFEIVSHRKWGDCLLY